MTMDGTRVSFNGISQKIDQYWMMIPDGNNDCNELDDIDRIEKLLEK